MAKTVVLSATDVDWLGWAKSYANRQPQARSIVTIPNGLSIQQAKPFITRAVVQAGADGVLVMSVGHGTTVAGSDVDGMVEIAPGGKAKLVGLNGVGTVNVFYNVRVRPDQPSDMENDLKDNPKSKRLADFRTYTEIGTQFRSTKLLRVVFLTCRVGKSREFLKKIANDWQTVVSAYTRRVAVTSVTYTQPGKPAVIENYCHFEGEKFPATGPNGGDQNAIAKEELPFRPGQQVFVGPPLTL